MASTVQSPQDHDPYADRRAYQRVTVALPGFLHAEGVRHFVQILDLSAGGAKLSCAADIPTGTAIILDCGTLSRAATVRWQNGDQLGLCFDQELDARDVAALAKRSTALGARMGTAK